jgi:amino acid adenylation domain-containing protein
VKEESSIESAYLTPGVAIIGMAGRFPGAADVAAFWRNLCDGVESISRFTDAELEDAFGPAIRNDPAFVRARGVLEGVEDFDASFFEMHAREAELTDPQHRVFLECAWQALEDAGYDPARYAGAIGVFAGCSINTYFLRNVCKDRAAAELFASNYQVSGYAELLGGLQDFLATKVSYKLNLRGPSATVQTACSTSLVAVALACQSLMLYQSDMALAGGVSISVPQRRGYLAQEGAMASTEGRCRTFDAKANGTVFGAGAAVVLLKRLEDALADGDHIYAVIRGSAINNDGARKVGFTAPSANGQAEVIAAALEAAGVDARTIGYVECHGTATLLGDPIEVAGLTKAFRVSTDDVGFCALGSVKPNVGHLDAAAGVAGLIKTALALQRARLPPMLFFETPNPHLALEGSPFYVNKEWGDWPRGQSPRRAGVSSFGLGGTNAHVVLEEPPAPASEASLRPVQVIVVSARSEAALESARKALARYIETHPELTLADVAFTQQVGRRRFAHRCAVACRDRESAIAALGSGQRLVSGSGAIAPTVAFMFPGQGAQYPKMGADLLATEPVFRASMHRSAEILKPALGRDLVSLLSHDAEQSLSTEALQATELAQPALFAVGFALAQLWRSWGVEPRMMIGHSVGEFVAACIAGVFSHEDALSLIAVRGRLMQDMPPGAMLAVRLPEAELAPLLKEPLALAAVNGPTLCVVAGPDEAVAELDAMLTVRGVMVRRLHTSHAFHTPMMDRAAAALEESFAGIRLAAPRLKCISSVTGSWLTDAEAVSPAYWAQQCRAPVRFGDGLATLLRDLDAEGRPSVLIEVGPGFTLSTLARQAGAGKKSSVSSSLPDASRSSGDDDIMGRSLAELWCQGTAVDWAAVHAGAKRFRVSLPTYPFERSRHWIDAPPPIRSDGTAAAVEPDPVEKIFAPESILVEKPPAMVSAQTEKPQTGAATIDNDGGAELESRIAALLENLSGESITGLSPQTSFLEMGFDSLFVSQVALELQREFKVKLTFRQLVGDVSTIPALAAHLAAKLPPQAPAAAPAPPALVESFSARQNSTAPSPRVFAAPVQRLTAAATTDIKGGAIEQVIRDQLDAMSRLMAQQLDALRASGAVEAGPTAQPRPAVAAAPLPTFSPPIAAPSAPPFSVPVPQPDPDPGKSRFEELAEARNAPAASMTEAQKQNLAALTARFNARTTISKALTAQYRQLLADPRAAAGFRQEWKDLVYPIVGDRALGARIWDVDGNAYIDLVNGYGQTAFGHSPPFVVEAVEAQLKKGFAIGPQAELAGKVAALFSDLTGDERVTFCNTGSEAVMAAMRVARTVTGRFRIATFSGDYHGQFDEVLVKGKGNLRAGSPTPIAAAAGIPQESVDNMVVLPYGAPESLEWIRAHADELAAVLVEPVQSRHPDLQPAAFIKQIRAITEAAGAALILDDVISGFRVHPGGMQAVLGIRADLATYGKVVGGGLPIGVLAGKAQFMDALDGGMWRYGDDSYPETGVTFFAGTFVRHPLVLAAAWAVLNHIKENGPGLQEGLNARTAALVQRLNSFLKRRGVDAHIETFSSWFYFNFSSVSRLSGLFYPHMLERGVYIQDHYPCFLTTAHSESDIKAIAEAFESSIIAMQEAGFMPGGPSGPNPSVAAVPLTEAQTEVWLAAQISDDASCAFNESVTLRLLGALDRSALETALNQVVARHDALRGSFDPNGDVMRIAPSLNLKIGERSLEARPGAVAEAEWEAFLKADAETPFDLANGPLIRAQFVRRASDDHALVLTMHHIVCDGWSMNVVIDELAKLYDAARGGAAADLPEPMAFSRYVAQERAREEQQGAAVEAFWLPQFSSPPPPLNLPTDRPRQCARTFRGATVTGFIDGETAQRFRKAAARQRCTMFVALLAAFETLLGKLSGQEDVVVGVPAAGQSLIEDGSLVGHCVNFLPLRGRWDATTTLAEHLEATRQIVLGSYEHQSFTLGTLVRKLSLARESGQRPLVEAAFNLERLGNGLSMAGLTVETQPNPKQFVNFDLFFNFTERDSGLRVDCDYNTDLFEAATIKRWIGHYRTLLDAMARNIIDCNGVQPVAKLPLLTDAERATIIGALNKPPAHALDPRPVHELFEAQARRTPDVAALLCDDQQLTYRQLDLRANQFARRLQNLGVRPGDRVGLLTQRSIDAIVALLGTLKAGGAYVPLDPSYPSALISFMLKDCAPTLSLVQRDVAAFNLGEGPIADLSDALEAARGESDAPLGGRAAAQDLAYVMYTSGSTGHPKGVMIPHKAIARLVLGQDYASFGPQETFLQLAPLAFDASTFEIWGALLSGARLGIVSEPRPSLDNISDAIARYAATTAWFTAGLFNELVDHRLDGLRPLRQILVGGDVLSPAHIEKALAHLPDTQLINGYGPTENTTFSCCYRIPREGTGGGAVPIGSSIGHTDVYILGPDLEPQPMGVFGQICVGGDGLALGYLNLPNLTDEKFVASPFGSHESDRLYLTGDTARLSADHVIEFAGRSDRQVKINGKRVELDEIENVLRADPSVLDAIVMRENGGTRRLIAYLKMAGSAAKSEDQASGKAAIAALRAKLPDYMIPSILVTVDAFPLTPNGKVDRARLRVPAEPSAAEPVLAIESSPRELKLAEMWCETLNVKEVGPSSNFFELGGHSLLALRLVARVGAEFGVKIRIGALFEAPTLREFAVLISRLEKPGVAAGATANASSIVRIQPHGDKTPIIAIHNALMYYQLSKKLGKDRPFIGIPLFNHGEEPPMPSGSLSDIAANYVRLIRAAQPRGPYVLVGLCVAGAIAYEAARQLRSAGETVPLIVMADTLRPGYESSLSFAKRQLLHVSDILNSLGHRISLVRSGKATIVKALSFYTIVRQSRILDIAAFFGLIDPLEIGSDDHETWLFLRGLDAARRDFRASASVGDVLILKSDEILSGVIERNMGWTDLVKGRLYCHRISGWHEEMFQNEHSVSQIAELLEPLLEEIDVERARTVWVEGRDSAMALRPHTLENAGPARMLHGIGQMPSEADPCRIDIWHNILWSKYKGEVFSSLYKLNDKNELDIHFFQIAETNSDRVGLSTISLDHHRYPFDLLFKAPYDQVALIRRLKAILVRTIVSDAKLTILAGYANFEFWAQLLVLILKRRKVAVFCDSTIYDRKQWIVQGFFKRVFFRAVNGIFAYGSRSKEYVIHYGASPNKVYDQCQAAALPLDYAKEKVLAMRLKAAPSTDAPRYLYVGRLSPEKGLDTLLDAFAKVWAQNQHASLVLIGCGSLHEKLEQHARVLGLDAAVHFVGSKSGDELFKEYTKATVLVLPSTSEPWGLVVNEALSYGCPVIVSRCCGCVPELLRERKTGLVHEPNNVNDLAAKMSTAPAQFADIEKTACDCIALMSHYTPDKAAERLLAGLRNIISGRKVVPLSHKIEGDSHQICSSLDP